VPIVAQMHGPAIELDAPYVAEMARAETVRRFGVEALVDGYRVYTTVDSRLQVAADQAARRTLIECDRRHGCRGPVETLDKAALDDAARVSAVCAPPATGSARAGVCLTSPIRGPSPIAIAHRRVAMDDRWARLRRTNGRDPSLSRPPTCPRPGRFVYVQARRRVRAAQLRRLAPVAIDPNDGAIVALTGGFDYADSKYNRAMQARRQPGSAFKPFLYSAALEKGFTPSTLVNDAPILVEAGATQEEWRPQNITKRFYGPTPMREGLVRSRNLVSIRLLRGVGVGYAMKHIGAFGFGPEALPANLTLALGTGQVTPVEMARGFAVFANGGFRVSPNFVARVRRSTGGARSRRRRSLSACAHRYDADAPDATDP
jgi:penicillin-binding protein 1A